MRDLVLNLIMKLASENRRDVAVWKISRRRHNCEKVMKADKYVNGFAVTAMIFRYLGPMSFFLFLFSTQNC